MTKKFHLRLISTTLLLLFTLASTAGIKLPQLFQSGMVLQRNQTIPVWGTADKGENVTVTFRGKDYSATAGTDGKWSVSLPKQKAGGPYTMTIKGNAADAITLEDVMVGDVWLCSGQSNVDVHIERVYPQYAKDIDSYSNDNIRLFRIFTTPATERKDDVARTSWKHLSKENAWGFSALGYFLGQKMYKETGVPQGIIQCSLGGSPIQAWVDIDSVKAYGATSQEAQHLYTKYLLYTDQQYIDYMSKANNRAGDVWMNAMNQTDPGYGVFEKEDYDDSAWQTFSQDDNNAWARHNGRPIIGSMWLRQHIQVDAAHAGKPATMFIGTFHDMDYTYVNGKQVGVTYYQYPPRRYPIPAGLLHEGDNVITVRLICKSGMANFFKNKPHEIVFEDGLSAIPTSTDWLMHKGSLMMEGPLGGRLDTNNQASVLYNGMLHPVAPYALSGMVWYQGESNAGQGDYDKYLHMLIGGWRQLWNRNDLPFTIVQLANYMEPSDKPQERSSWASLREQQRQVALSDPYTTLTVNIDLGEASDIHPLRKREVAERCAMGLMNTVFGKKNALTPQPLSSAFAGSEQIVITMDQPLEKCDAVCELEVKGADGHFHNVSGKADGNKVTIDCKDVDMPQGETTVRYAWKDNPVKANLRNKQQLPATPFQINVK